MQTRTTVLMLHPHSRRLYLMSGSGVSPEYGQFGRMPQCSCSSNRASHGEQNSDDRFLRSCLLCFHPYVVCHLYFNLHLRLSVLLLVGFFICRHCGLLSSAPCPPVSLHKACKPCHEEHRGVYASVSSSIIKAQRWATSKRSVQTYTRRQPQQPL